MNTENSNETVKKNENKEVDGNPKKNQFAIWGLVVGIISVFFSSIGIIPILAIVLSSIGISKTKEPETGRGMAIAGLILGVIYFFAYLYAYGHI